MKIIDMVRPSNGSDGYLTYSCETCGYPFECKYKADLSEKTVYNTLMSMQSVYPEGTPYDNSVKYVTENIFPQYVFSAIGCAGFAMELSDKAFGDLPARFHFDFTKIRVGDIIRIDANAHSVIALKVDGNIITVAEGSYGGKVHWGRELDITNPEEGWAYVLTRYPE
ncbi:MAG: hypothetical protein ACI4JS_10365 [Oscillospiraceae bacterium]